MISLKTEVSNGLRADGQWSLWDVEKIKVEEYILPIYRWNKWQRTYKSRREP